MKERERQNDNQRDVQTKTRWFVKSWEEGEILKVMERGKKVIPTKEK